MVHGAPPLKQVVITQNASGHSGDYAERREFTSKNLVALCRCGHSKNAPFCDGSHVTAGEDLTEAASFAPLLEGSIEVDGPVQLLSDNEKYCSFARFCDNGQRIWNEVQLSGKSHEDLSISMAHHCPGGRLIVWDRATVKPIETPEPPRSTSSKIQRKGAAGRSWCAAVLPLSAQKGAVMKYVTAKRYAVAVNHPISLFAMAPMPHSNIRMGLNRAAKDFLRRCNGLPCLPLSRKYI